MYKAIEDALHRHVIVYLRNRQITPPQHIAGSRRFGPLEHHVFKEYLPSRRATIGGDPF